MVYDILVESGITGKEGFLNSEIYRKSVELGIITQNGSVEKTEEKPAYTEEEVKNAQEAVLSISGMWCSNCSWLIQKVLSNVPGIVDTAVSFATDSARIKYLPHYTSPVEITQEINALGYRAASKKDDEDIFKKTKKDLLIRMGIAIFFTANIMMLSFATYLGYFEDFSQSHLGLYPWVLWMLSTPVIFYSAFPLIKKGIHALITFSPIMESLISLGVITTYIYSSINTFIGNTDVYFDTSTMLVALVLTGKFLEVNSRAKVSRTITCLYNLIPKKVRLKTNGEFKFVSIKSLKTGDYFLVKSGEKIPTDGKIIEGATRVDESMITGESKPVRKSKEMRVIGSSINLENNIIVEAESTGDKTVLHDIIKLTENALTKKSSIEKTVDKIARAFIPVIISVSLITAVAMWFLNFPFNEIVIRAVTIIVVSCPCAFGIATPLAVAIALGNCIKKGIIVRESTALEIIKRVNTYVFDKTGTLTGGKFALLNTFSPETNVENVLNEIAALEKLSNHPIAAAITGRIKGSNLPVTNFSEVKGKGIKGTVNGRIISIGSSTLMEDQKWEMDESMKKKSSLQESEGKTVVFFGWEDKVRGFMTFGDELKLSAEPVVQNLLKINNTDVWLVSGDSAATTKMFAEKAGIENFKGEALPQDKIFFIKELQDFGKNVCMIGDGINDAPALAQADVSIAIGSGTDIAQETSDIILMRDDLTLIHDLIEISKKTIKTIKQNLILAFFYNSVCIPIAIAGLLNPVIAVILMLISSLFVTGNSLRLRKI